MFSGRELVLVLLCVAVLLCIGSAQPQPKESAVKRLLSNDATTRKEAQQELVAARADVVSELVSIIDDKDNQLTRSDSVRAAMFVLGEMRNHCDSEWERSNYNQCGMFECICQPRQAVWADTGAGDRVVYFP